MFKVTNYIIVGSRSFDSEPMTFELALEIFNDITKQAIRGLRPFPDLINAETGEIIA